LGNREGKCPKTSEEEPLKSLLLVKRRERGGRITSETIKKGEAVSRCQGREEVRGAGRDSIRRRQWRADGYFLLTEDGGEGEYMIHLSRGTGRLFPLPSQTVGRRKRS